MKLQPAKNQRAYVLRKLLTNKEISEQDCRINGFRARISELNNYIQIPFTVKKFITELGKKSTFRAHFIPKKSKNEAIEVYNKINLK